MIKQLKRACYRSWKYTFLGISTFILWDNMIDTDQQKPHCVYRWYNNQWHTCLIFYVPVFSFRAPAVCIVRTVDTIFTSCLPWELRTSISYFQQKVTSSVHTQLFRFFSHTDCKTTIWTDNSTCSNVLVHEGYCKLDTAVVTVLVKTVAFPLKMLVLATL